jgi:hypothetical protein
MYFRERGFPPEEFAMKGAESFIRWIPAFAGMTGTNERL